MGTDRSTPYFRQESLMRHVPNLLAKPVAAVGVSSGLALMPT